MAGVPIAAASPIRQAQVIPDDRRRGGCRWVRCPRPCRHPAVVPQLCRRTAVPLGVPPVPVGVPRFRWAFRRSALGGGALPIGAAAPASRYRPAADRRHGRRRRQRSATGRHRRHARRNRRADHPRPRAPSWQWSRRRRSQRSRVRSHAGGRSVRSCDDRSRRRKCFRGSVGPGWGGVEQRRCTQSVGPAKQGTVVGVAHPVVVTFTGPVANRAAAGVPSP